MKIQRGFEVLKAFENECKSEKGILEQKIQQNFGQKTNFSKCWLKKFSEQVFTQTLPLETFLSQFDQNEMTFSVFGTN